LDSKSNLFIEISDANAAILAYHTIDCSDICLACPNTDIDPSIGLQADKRLILSCWCFWEPIVPHLRNSFGCRHMSTAATVDTKDHFPVLLADCKRVGYFDCCSEANAFVFVIRYVCRFGFLSGSSVLLRELLHFLFNSAQIIRILACFFYGLDYFAAFYMFVYLYFSY